VRPAPEEATHAESLEVLQSRLWKDDCSKVSQEFVTSRSAACLPGNLRVRYVEWRAIAFLKDQLPAEMLRDSRQVIRVDGDSSLVFLVRRSNDPEFQHDGPVLACCPLPGATRTVKEL